MYESDGRLASTAPARVRGRHKAAQMAETEMLHDHLELHIVQLELVGNEKIDPYSSP